MGERLAHQLLPDIVAFARQPALPNRVVEMSFRVSADMELTARLG